MPESTRFREKTSDKRLKQYNDSNFMKTTSKGDRCSQPSDYYAKNKGRRTRTKSRTRSRTKSRTKSRRDNKRESYTQSERDPMRTSKQSQRESYIRETKHKKYPDNPNSYKKRAKSHNFSKHNNNCRCYICTCRRSNHKCPVSKGYGKPFLGKTINRTDFKEHPREVYKEASNPMGRELNMPRDNLRFVGDFKPNTDYRDNFRKHMSGNQEYTKDREFNNFIRDKNNEDHLKKGRPDINMISKQQHREFKHGQIDPVYYPLKRYRKSASPIRSSAPFLGTTVYQKDFKKWAKPQKHKQYKHQENLRAYNPEIPLAKFTEYNHANYMHMINRNGNSNRELFELFKKRDQIPGGVIPSHGTKKGKRSEYAEKYKKWQVNRDDCDLEYMPKVSPDLARLKEHIYWNKYKDDWTCRQDSYYE